MVSTVFESTLRGTKEGETVYNRGGRREKKVRAGAKGQKREKALTALAKKHFLGPKRTFLQTEKGPYRCRKKKIVHK